MDSKSGAIMPLDTYLRVLLAFLQAVRAGVVFNLPEEKDSLVSHLRLSANGLWEITETFLATRTLASVPDLFIPLVLPLSPIILVAHLETQWVRHEAEAGVPSSRLW